jgi:hypothetical protein
MLRLCYDFFLWLASAKAKLTLVIQELILLCANSQFCAGQIVQKSYGFIRMRKLFFVVVCSAATLDISWAAGPLGRMMPMHYRPNDNRTIVVPSIEKEAATAPFHSVTEFESAATGPFRPLAEFELAATGPFRPVTEFELAATGPFHPITGFELAATGPFRPATNFELAATGPFHPITGFELAATGPFRPTTGLN